MTKRLGTALLLGILLAGKAQAFPHAIGHGYSSCLNCHFNPAGGGPLTDYGRAVSATAFAAVPFYAQGKTPEEKDEYLGSHSGLLGSTPLPFWLRPGGNFRELHLVSDLGAETSLTRWITMQAEANLVLRSKKDGLIAVGSIGYIPTPKNPSGSQRDSAQPWISREHYLGARFGRELGIYAGMMSPVFGIRVPDHSAYLRSKTLLNQNDQSHGLLLHYERETWQSDIHLLAGNLLQSTPLRQRGFAARIETDWGKDSRWGVSGLFSENQYRSRSLGALHARLGFGHGSAFLGQLGVIREAPVSANPQLGGYGFGQYSLALARGLNLMATTEYYTADWTIAAPRRFRAGPSIQYLPMQRIELRVDLLGSRSSGGETLDPDTFTLQSQVHIWL